MSSDLRKFGGAMWDLFVEWKLPSDDTPLVGSAPPAPGPPSYAAACPRCDGEGEVCRKGVIVPCDAEPACAFRKGRT